MPLTRESLQKILLEHWTWFHEHPELSFTEYKTSARISSILAEFGAEVVSSQLDTGVIARIAPDKPSTRAPVALRADIDALPVLEQTGFPHASKNPGIMHACGHDFHLTALLGCAMLLCERRNELDREVKLVFQPAEEISKGAEAVLKSGFLDDVGEIYGLHVQPELKAGTVAASPGAAYAGVGVFKITVHGKGGHAGIPQDAIDPVIAATRIIQDAQTAVSRAADPLSPAVLSITHIEAGKAWNVIPETAFLEGTIRVLSDVQWDRVSDALKKICAGVALSSGAAVDADIERLSPPTNNDAALTESARNTARALGFSVVDAVPRMVGEDFALYQQKIRGVFLQFGVESPYGLHHPQFAANTDCLASASELLCALAVG